MEFFQVTWSSQARTAWRERHYHRLTQDKPGLVGCVVNRAEAQVVRLAMIYCLLDGGTVIEEIHLNAALALWDYCEQSARFAFNGRLEDNTAQTILDALQQQGALTGKKIHALFGNNLTKAKLNDAMSSLVAAGHVIAERVKGKGRPATTYHFQKKPYELNEKNELSASEKAGHPINSFNSFNSLSGFKKTTPPGESINSLNSLNSQAVDGFIEVEMNTPPWIIREEI